MGKARGKPAAGPPAPTQYNVRLNDPELERRVAATARGLGLDGANFFRLVIRECLAVYERRVEAIERGDAPGGLK